jgi:hypothetical protein
MTDLMLDDLDRARELRSDDDMLMLDPGTHVEVRRRFDRAWARGFVIHRATDAGYQLRRTSDGAVLPVAFPAVDVRSSPRTR